MSVLEVEVDRLANAVAHLQRSNAELKAALQEGGPDPEYKLAIEENIVTIAKHRARMEALKEEIKRVTGQPHEPERVEVGPGKQQQAATGMDVDRGTHGSSQGGAWL